MTKQERATAKAFSEAKGTDRKVYPRGSRYATDPYRLLRPGRQARRAEAGGDLPEAVLARVLTQVLGEMKRALAASEADTLELERVLAEYRRPEDTRSVAITE